MNKTKFNSLLSYLYNHPTDAVRLKEVLDKIKPETGLQAQEGTDEWLTAKDVGERIGMSSRWVRDRLKKLPINTIEQSGKRNTWYINFPLVRNQLLEMKKQ